MLKNNPEKMNSLQELKIVYPENRFPNCLFLKLNLKKTLYETPEIFITVNFNEEKLFLRLGTVKFGISKGELIFKINNGKIPYDCRSFTALFEPFLEKQRTIQSTDNNEFVNEDLNRINVGVSAMNGKANMSVGAKETITKKGKKEIQDKFTLNKWQITTKGTEENPTWCFKCETGEEILCGSLINEKLATLYVLSFPCDLVAEFTVSPEDIHINYAETFWHKNITNNKKSIIKILIEKAIRKKIIPYLSRDKIIYE